MQVDSWTVNLADARQVQVTHCGGHWSLWPVGWSATWHVDAYCAVTDVFFKVGQRMRFVAVDEGDEGIEEQVVLPVVTGVSGPGTGQQSF